MLIFNTLDFSYHASAPLEEASLLARQKIPSAAALKLYTFNFDDFALDDSETLQVRKDCFTSIDCDYLFKFWKCKN